MFYDTGILLSLIHWTLVIDEASMAVQPCFRAAVASWKQSPLVCSRSNAADILVIACYQYVKKRIDGSFAHIGVLPNPCSTAIFSLESEPKKNGSQSDKESLW
jgi:hypothetical protein